MSHLFQNVNISIAREGQLPFLQSLAKKDRGEMSRYIRGLIESDPGYQEYLRSHQMP